MKLAGASYIGSFGEILQRQLEDDVQVDFSDIDDNQINTIFFVQSDHETESEEIQKYYYSKIGYTWSEKEPVNTCTQFKA